MIDPLAISGIGLVLSVLIIVYLFHWALFSGKYHEEIDPMDWVIQMLFEMVSPIPQPFHQVLKALYSREEWERLPHAFVGVVREIHQRVPRMSLPVPTDISVWPGYCGCSWYSSDKDVCVGITYDDDLVYITARIKGALVYNAACDVAEFLHRIREYEEVWHTGSPVPTYTWHNAVAN